MSLALDSCCRTEVEKDGEGLSIRQTDQHGQEEVVYIPAMYVDAFMNALKLAIDEE